METYHLRLFVLLTLLICPTITNAETSHLDLDKANPTLTEIRNFHFVSKNLASSGLLAFDKYNDISQYGFKHVINLIPGNQDEERAKVESLGISFEQIPVEWSEPTLENLARFFELMNSYGGNKVFVHCEANYRASTFVYLYRIYGQGIAKEKAKIDLFHIWKPSKTWLEFIEKAEIAYQE